MSTSPRISGENGGFICMRDGEYIL